MYENTFFYALGDLIVWFISFLSILSSFLSFIFLKFGFLLFIKQFSKTLIDYLRHSLIPLNVFTIINYPVSTA